MAFDFNMDNKSFIQLMGNGFKYSVPKFQRDYSWDEEQWEDLWQDINNNNGSPWHYMGYLLLQPVVNDIHQYQIIDGQQRIATTTIIILAVLNELKALIDKGNDEADNKKRLDTIHNQYMIFTDKISLQKQRKLKLNRNNDRFFRKLSSLDEPMLRGAKYSDLRMYDALKFFRKKIKNELVLSGEELAKFVGRLEDRLFFTIIEVKNDLNAYTVFETLNARGVKLSTPDLIKNYLFSQIDKDEDMQDEEIDQLEESWGAILEQLGSDGDFSRFIQVEWNSYHSKIQKAGLFREIKNTIKDKKSACDYVKRLEKSVQIYAALRKPEDSFWKDNYQDNASLDAIQKALKTLQVFSIKQPHSLLMSAWLNFIKEDFVKIARYIEVISIRYNAICRGHPNEQEDFYNGIACDISGGVLKNAYLVKNKLKEIYKNDTEFSADFERKIIKTPSDARYILERIEEFIKPSHKVAANSTLEHILPKNPSADWENLFLSDEINDFVWRIGNMTLLEKKTNQKIGNKNYSEKREVLLNSNYEINKIFAEYDEWSKEAIDERQKWLAEQAVKCWRIDFE